MIKSILIKLTIVLNLIKFRIHGVNFGQGMRVRGLVSLNKKKAGKLIIGSNFNLISGMMINPLGKNIRSVLRVDYGASLVIGNNVGMSCVTVWAKKKILIGSNVKIGAEVIIFDSDMHSLDFILRRDEVTDSADTVSKEIIIGNDVFIGARSIITKGVTIGEHSIIASGSVVSKSIPSNEIWGGNPIVFLKKITTK